MEHFVTRRENACPGCSVLLILAWFLRETHRRTCAVCFLGHRIEQIANDPMTHGSDANLLALAYELADHARAAKRFARPGRPLNGEDGFVEITHDPHRKFYGALVFAGHERRGHEPRRFGGEKCASSAVANVSSHDAFADSEQRVRDLLARDM